MSNQSSLNLQALPDGGAEVRLVLRLHWEDVAALGREAGRLAAQRHRPVGLDEAAVHALRTWSAPTAPAAPTAEPAAKPRSESAITASAPPNAALTMGSPAEHARPTVQQAKGSAPASASVSAVAAERPRHAASALDYPATAVTSLAGRITESTGATG